MLQFLCTSRRVTGVTESRLRPPSSQRAACLAPLAPLGAALLLACAPTPPATSPVQRSAEAGDPGAGTPSGLEAAEGWEAAPVVAAPGGSLSPRPGAEGRSAPTATRGRPARGSVAYLPPWGPSSFKGIKVMEDRIVAYVNRLRKGRGLAPLKPDERLRVAARQHSLEMIAKRYYGHSSPVKAWSGPALRACHAGFLDPYVSENIGKVAGFGDPALALFESWRRSPGHFANMVQPRMSYIGVGVVHAGGATYIGTQLFGTNVLDFRNLKVVRRRRRVLRLTVDLFAASRVDVKAWMGSRFLADVPRRGRGARFRMDLAPSRPRSIRLDFAVKVGAQVPLLCAHVAVAPGGAVSVRRITFDRRCRQITGVRARTGKLTLLQRVLTGEARAATSKALKTRFYLNHQWGDSARLRLGRWVGFAQVLSKRRTLFSMVVGGVVKDYLRIHLGKSPVFRCP